MSYTLEIPDTLYTALKEAADANGLTPLDWIAAHLRSPQKTPGKETEQERGPRTLVDLFAGRIGRIRSGSKEHLSEEYRAKFIGYLEEKRRAGHL